MLYLILKFATDSFFSNQPGPTCLFNLKSHYHTLNCTPLSPVTCCLPVLTKRRSRWLDIGQVLFACLQKKSKATLTEQAWPIQELVQGNFFNTKKNFVQRWPHGQCAPLWIGQSGFELWPGTLCCVLGQDTLLSHNNMWVRVDMEFVFECST